MKADRQLQEDILQELDWEPSIDASRIGVEVSDGVVTLTGKTASYAQKWAAEYAARRVPGVRGVAAEIEAALYRRAHLDASAIQVDVSEGSVTLAGEVDSLAEHDTVQQAAWSAPGVQRVIDHLRIAD